MLSQNNFLFNDIALLPSIGTNRRAFYLRLMGDRIVDVLWHFPINIQTRRLIDSFTSQHVDRLVTFKAEILGHAPSKRYGKPYRISAINNTGQMVELLFFHGRAPYLNRIAKTGSTVVISGKLSFQKFLGADQWKFIHPDYIGPLSELNDWTGTERMYPLTAGLNQGMVRSVIKTTLERLSSMPNGFRDMDSKIRSKHWSVDTYMKRGASAIFENQISKDEGYIPEWLDPHLLQQKNWPTWSQALYQIHHAQKISDLEITNPAKQRLVYDELLAHQLSLLLTHRQTVKLPAVSLNPSGKLSRPLIDQLPFQLTSCQLKAYQEISNDLQQSHQSLRLLQGDVGSGKTIVALLAALQAIESGYQATLLAPTDILARQHYHTLQRLTESLNISVAILTGREKGKLRKQILNDLESGKIHLLIGTHAIIQDPIQFHQLGLAIVDEQHRFGVKQRLALSFKGLNPHILSMTATPIPRTLMLANYGDMDVSTLAHKPPGRQSITTRVLSLSRLDEVVEGLKRKIAENQKCYWVCPLVEESETLDLTAAMERYDHLHKLFPEQVALVHGRLKSQEKETVMEQFIKGHANILVATTVIEVGIDVPAATIMVIEHAERFGLAQLHQLRGRVGRGTDPSSCLLLYGQPLSPIARKRLAAIRDSDNGFAIAEADLKLRGGGEILGLRQSGLPKFRLFDLNNNPDEPMDEYNDLFVMANKEAKQILANDPQLQSKRSEALQLLLRLFKHEQALQYRRSG